jgi:hypothetical protein
MARGIPSRRRQIQVMASELSGVGLKAGSTALARSMKSCVGSESTSASTGTDASASGSDNEGTRQMVSPDTPSASRLVARIRNAGAPRSRGLNELGARSDQVLAGIQHEQELTIAESETNRTNLKKSNWGAAHQVCHPLRANMS